MLKDTLGSAVEAIGATSGIVMIAAPKARVPSFNCVATYNAPEDWTAVSYPFDSSPLNAKVFTTGRPVTANHLHKRVAGSNVTSALVVPVFDKASAIGTIELTTYNPQATFNNQDVKTLLEYADKIGKTYAKRTAGRRTKKFLIVFNLGCALIGAFLAPTFLEPHVGFAARNVPAMPTLAYISLALIVYILVSTWWLYRRYYLWMLLNSFVVSLIIAGLLVTTI